MPKSIDFKKNVAERNFDSKGNCIFYRDKNGFSYEKTYDEKGNLLTYKNSNGRSYEKTYDENGKLLRRIEN